MVRRDITASRLRLARSLLLRAGRPLINNDLSDTPYGRLPGAAPIVLSRHKIEVAVAEVRFNHTGALSTSHGLALRDACAAVDLSMTSLESTQRGDVSLTFGAQGASSTTVVDDGWVLSSADRSLTITLFPDLMFVQSTAYTRFSESLVPALTAGLAYVQRALHPELVQRVGLRYVNRLTDPLALAPTAWRGRLAPSLLGVLEDDTFGPRVSATQQSVELSLEPGVGALVRHGAFQDASFDGAFSYLVDLDIFNVVTDPYDPIVCLDVAQRLNRSALTLFQQIVLPAFRATMGPSPAYPVGAAT